MRRVILSLFLVSAAFPETPSAGPPKAPPEVEAALRARVSEFFQFQVQGKFYSALKFVAEDSKEFFVGSNKPTYLSFEIKNITYSDNVTKAVAMVQVQRMVPVEGFLGHPLSWSVPSRWKVEEGQWCWYVDPEDLRQTPFGKMPKGSTLSGPPPRLPGATATSGAPPSLKPAPVAPPAAAPAMPQAAAQAVPPGVARPLPPGGLQSLLQGMPGTPGGGGIVAADKSALSLKAGEVSSDQVTLVNQMSMPVTLSLLWGGVPGFSAKLDRKALRPGEKAVVSLQTNALVKATARATTVTVRVEQTNQLIPIQVSFSAPGK